MLLRFLDKLSTFSVLECSGGRFTLNEGSFGREARSPKSMLCDLSKGLGPIVEAPVPELDGRPTVDAGFGHIGRFLEELAVVTEAVYRLWIINHKNNHCTLFCQFCGASTAFQITEYSLNGV